MQRRIGIIIPSSNTVVEPATERLLRDETGVTAHFARFRVTEISDDPASRAQFEIEAVVAAASRLADAEVDAILWSGTAASWLGFAWDDTLVSAIETATGTPATTAVRAITNELRQAGAETIGLVTPYVAAIEGAIVETYREIGIKTVARERLDLTENTAYGRVDEETIAGMVRAVATGPDRPDAVIIMCTNLAGAFVAPALTEDLRLPVIDSVRAAMMAGLALTASR